MRVNLFAALGALKIGLDILFEQEHTRVDQLLGHGGFFKTPEVGQRMMAAATNVPVSVLATAGEGGAWGMALLAAYLRQQAPGETLEDYLTHKVFAGELGTPIAPDPADVAGFAAFMQRYQAGLVIERTAVAALK
jgi:sugar (pentulose or hexulose) kinase